MLLLPAPDPLDLLLWHEGVHPEGMIVHPIEPGNLRRFDQRRRERSRLPVTPDVIALPASVEQLRLPHALKDYGIPFQNFRNYFDWRISRLCINHHEYFPELAMHIVRVGNRSFLVLFRGVCHHISGFSENEAVVNLRQQICNIYAEPPAAPAFSVDWLPVGEYRTWPGLGIVCRVEDVKGNITCWILRTDKPAAYEIQGDSDAETLLMLLEESLHLLNRKQTPASAKMPVQAALFASY